MLRGQDILLTLQLFVSGPKSYAGLGQAIGISASQAHAASKRAIASGILRADMTVRQSALLEVLVALKYYFPAERGGEARGIPTAHAAPPLDEHIRDNHELTPVWPHPEGHVRGLSCEPIYKTAPTAALRNKDLYEYLALIDALRIGNAREQQLARQILTSRLKG